MILYYFPIAQNTVNKTVSDFFLQRCKYLFMYRMCTYLTIFLFTGLIPVYSLFYAGSNFMLHVLGGGVLRTKHMRTKTHVHILQWAVENRDKICI